MLSPKAIILNTTRMAFRQHVYILPNCVDQDYATWENELVIGPELRSI